MSNARDDESTLGLCAHIIMLFQFNVIKDVFIVYRGVR